MKKAIIGIIIFLLFIALYGFYLNPSSLTTQNYTIATGKIPSSFDGFKIAQFSDVLIGANKTDDDLEKIVQRINKEQVDIIVFTGDLIYKDYTPSNEEITKIKEILNKLECSLYKYAVIGDNDEANLDTYKEIMSETDFTLLDNKYEYLFFEDTNPLKIIGLDNLNNLDTLYREEENITPFSSLVLTHYPDYADTLSNYPTDIILSGHSLGGQIKIPFFDGIIKKDKARKYLNSYYQVNNTLLYISNGIGCEKVNFRFLNTPSINIYTLKKVS